MAHIAGTTKEPFWPALELDACFRRWASNIGLHSTRTGQLYPNQTLNVPVRKQATTVFDISFDFESTETKLSGRHIPATLFLSIWDLFWTASANSYPPAGDVTQWHHPASKENASGTASLYKFVLIIKHSLVYITLNLSVILPWQAQLHVSMWTNHFCGSFLEAKFLHAFNKKTVAIMCFKKSKN